MGHQGYLVFPEDMKVVVLDMQLLRRFKLIIRVEQPLETKASLAESSFFFLKFT